MAKPLTIAQRALLTDMENSPPKSGKFWSALGNTIQTLISLEKRGFVTCTNFGGSPSRSQYRIAQEGIDALEEQGRWP